MSVHVLSWVLKHSPVDNPTERLVLLVLADKANDDGRGAYPKQETIGREARRPERTVRDALASLEAAGHIEREGTAGYRKRTVVWRVVMADPIRRSLPDSRGAESGEIEQSNPAELSPDSRVEASTEPSEPSSLSLDGSGRGPAARAAWEAMVPLVKTEVTEFIWHAWFEPIVGLDYRRGRLVLGAPSHVCGWNRERYGELLGNAAAKALGEPTDVELTVLREEARAA